MITPLYIKPALLVLLNKAGFFLIPCPFKYLTTLDCPGCGFQRSVIALFSGHLHESFQLYPPTIPFLLSFVLGVSATIFKLNTNSKLLKGLYLLTGMIMLINYGYKIINHQLH